MPSPREVVGRYALEQPSDPLNVKVHRIGIWHSRRAPSSNGDKLCIERLGETRDNFVLHVEAVGQGFIESLRPKMTAASGVDQLDADAHPIAATLNAPRQDIANVQLAADLHYVEGLALVRHSRVVGDVQDARQARKVGG